jgi:hypothetical protein
MAINPRMKGEYGKGERGRNDQGPGKDTFEDRVLSRGPQPPLGNMVARDVGGGGPGVGYSVSKSGQQATHGAVNPGVAVPMGPHPIDRIYGRR